MIDILKLFPLISLIITHPLEQISLADFQAPGSLVSFLDRPYYASPEDGYVKCILEADGFFQVTLSLDGGSEVVYSGLTEVMKGTGDRIIRGEFIGIDASISPGTNFILIVYEHSKLFPQFAGSSLIFVTDQGTRVYMVHDGISIALDWDLRDKGVNLQVKLEGRNTYISFRHLLSAFVTPGSFLLQGGFIAATGNTGSSEYPMLALHIEDEDFGSDLRVIYFRQAAF